MALLSAGSSHICRLAASVSNVKPICPLGTHPPAVSSKALSLVHYSVTYTTLSTLIYSCFLNHHLYADETQLFLCFLPTHLDFSIDDLNSALDRASSWMTANLLTLNSSKTEFLLIGLSKQLVKINNASLTITHSARNLGFIFGVNDGSGDGGSSTTVTLFITTCPSLRSPGFNRSRTLLHVLLCSLF